MSKLILLSMITTFGWAGVLETKAEIMGSSKAIDIFMGQNIVDIEVAKNECQKYSNTEYKDKSLSGICYESCVKSIEKNLQKKNAK